MPICTTKLLERTGQVQRLVADAGQGTPAREEKGLKRRRAALWSAVGHRLGGKSVVVPWMYPSLPLHERVDRRRPRRGAAGLQLQDLASFHGVEGWFPKAIPTEELWHLVRTIIAAPVKAPATPSG